MGILPIVALLLPMGLVMVQGVEPEEGPCGGEVFERTVSVLRERFYDRGFAEQQLGPLAERFRQRAHAACTVASQRRVTFDFLSHVPASHTALLSGTSYHHLLDELWGRSVSTVGFEVVELEGGFFVHGVEDRGPADRAGLRNGDRLVSLNGFAVENSRLLDWRMDDAYLDDPPTHLVLAEEGDTMELVTERVPGVRETRQVQAAPYSLLEASEASTRLFTREGHRIGYFHLWLVSLAGPDEALQRALEGPLAEAEALVFDLRGRGGSGTMIPRLLDVLDGPEARWEGPVVALVDHLSRSAKDVLAYELKETGRARLVGEATAGAVLPAVFEDVGEDSYLMFPAFVYPQYTDLLELRPVEPDVSVASAGPFAAGEDPILDRGLEVAVQEIEVNALLDRMVEALGGEGALRSLQGLTMKGTYELIGTPVSGTVVIQAAPPRKLLVTTDLGPMGVALRAYDGEVGWTDGPSTGRKRIEGRELEQLRIQADFFGPLSYRELYDSLEIEGITDFGGRRCYELVLTTAGGSRAVDYVDAETFLLAGSETVMEVAGSDVTVTTTFSEYRVFDGRPVAMVQLSDVGGFQQQRVTFTDVRVGPLDPGVFARPDWVAGSRRIRPREEMRGHE